MKQEEIEVGRFLKLWGSESVKVQVIEKTEQICYADCKQLWLTCRVWQKELGKWLVCTKEFTRFSYIEIECLWDDFKK